MKVVIALFFITNIGSKLVKMVIFLKNEMVMSKMNKNLKIINEVLSSFVNVSVLLFILFQTSFISTYFFLRFLSPAHFFEPKDFIFYKDYFLKNWT